MPCKEVYFIRFQLISISEIIILLLIVQEKTKADYSEFQLIISFRLIILIFAIAQVKKGDCS